MAELTWTTMETKLIMAVMKELVKARHHLEPYPPGDWNNEIVWSTLMEEVLLKDHDDLKQQNVVMSIVYKLERVYLTGETNTLPEQLVVLMHTVFGPLNEDGGGLTTYALDPSILPLQRTKSDVPELGIITYDYEEEECAAFAQSLRKGFKLLQTPALETVDVYDRRRHFDYDFQAGNSSCPSQNFRQPHTTVVSTTQMAVVYNEATKHLDPVACARLLCRMPMDSLKFGLVARKPACDRPELVSSLHKMAETDGSHIQQHGSP